MGAGEPTLDDHSFRCVMERLGVETEVRKSSLVLLEQRVDAIVAIPNFAGGDDLVTGMRKYCDAAVELVRVPMCSCTFASLCSSAVRSTLTITRPRTWLAPSAASSSGDAGSCASGVAAA